MKLQFFNRSARDQAAIIREVAARRGISAVMVEKDFWVSWTLAVLFAHPEFGEQLGLQRRHFVIESLRRNKEIL